MQVNYYMTHGWSKYYNKTWWHIWLSHDHGQHGKIVASHDNSNIGFYGMIQVSDNGILIKL